MGGKFMSEEIITETNRETATDHEYGGAQIQVLEGLAVRKRPGMYIVVPQSFYLCASSGL